MFNEVIISALKALHNQLGVKEDKAAEEDETTIEIQLRGGEGERGGVKRKSERERGGG